MQEYMSVLWLIGFVIALVVEGSCICLLAVWFAGGALAAMAAALLGAQIWRQVVLCFAVSIALLALVRPIARKHFTPKLARTNIDSVIGARGYVTQDIDNLSAPGTVKLGGMEWTARSTSGEPVPQGTLVQVDKFEGVKVFVSAVEK